MAAIDRVTRWTPVVVYVLERHDLDVPEWVVLSQIDVEGAGYKDPNAALGVEHAAQGVLQIQPGMAETCGYRHDEVDGSGEPWLDAYRSIDCWATYQSRFVGESAPIWDYPLAWYAGPGTLEESRERREAGQDVLSAWYAAADQTLPSIGGADAIYSYLRKWVRAARDYWRWSTGGQA